MDGFKFFFDSFNLVFREENPSVIPFSALLQFNKLIIFELLFCFKFAISFPTKCRAAAMRMLFCCSPFFIQIKLTKSLQVSLTPYIEILSS